MPKWADLDGHLDAGTSNDDAATVEVGKSYGIVGDEAKSFYIDVPGKADFLFAYHDSGVSGTPNEEAYVNPNIEIHDGTDYEELVGREIETRDISSGTVIVRVVTESQETIRFQTDALSDTTSEYILMVKDVPEDQASVWNGEWALSSEYGERCGDSDFEATDGPFESELTLVTKGNALFYEDTNSGNGTVYPWIDLYVDGNNATGVTDKDLGRVSGDSLEMNLFDYSLDNCDYLNVVTGERQ